MTLHWPMMILVAGALGVGCAGTEEGSEGPLTQEAYAAQNAQITCELYERCELLEPYGEDQDACETAIEEVTYAFVSREECTFNAQAAAECLEETSLFTCSDLYTETEETSPCEVVCG